MYMLHIFVLLSSLITLVSSEGVCDDDWDQFNDDYYAICYRYYPNSADPYLTVVNFCQTQLDSSLPTINTPEEQEFLNSMIVKYKIVDNIWLDAGVKNKHIVWADKTSTDYENWKPGQPTTENNCVEISTDEYNLGKWADKPCGKKNSYICKRIVPMPIQRSERLMRDNLLRLHRDKLKIAQLEQSVTKLSKNQIPIGFIYVQLPGQVKPDTLWPDYTWSDVTAQYAGQFFRAEGNASLRFGEGVQSDNSPRLSSVKWEEAKKGDSPTNITPGNWSGLLFSGGDQGTWFYHRYFVAGGEVRPINQSVRIFKRIN